MILLLLLTITALLSLAEPEKNSRLISRNKPVTASREYSSNIWLIGQLTDGLLDNRGSIWVLAKTCAHTANDLQSWFTIDLERAFPIDYVKVYNRMDCCNDRLSGSRIYVSLKDGDLETKKSLECGLLDSGGIQTVKCPQGTKGRFVHVIQVLRRYEYLNICEMEVYGKDLFKQERAIIISRGKAVTASSLWDTWRPAHLTDGSLNICSHTNFDNPSWFKIDLGNIFIVGSVKVYNRRDACQQRLAGSKIYVYFPHGDPVECGTLDASLEQTASCPYFTPGRFVSLAQVSRQEYLNVCEVEVFGFLYTGKGGSMVGGSK